MKIQVTPVFKKTKDVYDSMQYRQIVNMGGSRCFSPQQKVVTSRGGKAISSIKPGDKVLTLNESTNENEWKVVRDNLRFENEKKAYKITLKNGVVIMCTQDHEFRHKGGWVAIKDIIKEVTIRKSRNAWKRLE